MAAITPYPSYEMSRKSEFSKLAFDIPFEIALPIATSLMSIPLTLAASQNKARVKWPSPHPNSRTFFPVTNRAMLCRKSDRGSAHLKCAKGRHWRKTRQNLMKFAQFSACQVGGTASKP